MVLAHWSVNAKANATAGATPCQPPSKSAKTIIWKWCDYWVVAPNFLPKNYTVSLSCT